MFYEYSSFVICTLSYTCNSTFNNLLWSRIHYIFPLVLMIFVEDRYIYIHCWLFIMLRKFWSGTYFWFLYYLFIGKESLVQWMEQPSHPNTTLSWSLIHGISPINPVQEICLVNHLTSTQIQEMEKFSKLLKNLLIITLLWVT